MAKKGIEYCCFGKLKADGTYEAGQGMRFSPVVAFNFSPNSNNERDYGDNRIDDVDNETTGGTLTVELNRDPDDLFEYVLGHAIDSSGDGVETIFHTEDATPELGVGAIGKTGTRATGYKYRAKVYRRVVFAEPADDNQTKTNTANFGHTTLTGEVMPLTRPANLLGQWKVTEAFNTKVEAKEWLNAYLGVLETEYFPVTLFKKITKQKRNSDSSFLYNINMNFRVSIPSSYTVTSIYRLTGSELDVNGDPGGSDVYRYDMATSITGYGYEKRNISASNTRHYLRFYCEYLDPQGNAHLAKSPLFYDNVDPAEVIGITNYTYTATEAQVPVQVGASIPSGATFSEVALLFKAASPAHDENLQRTDANAAVGIVDQIALAGRTSYQLSTSVTRQQLSTEYCMRAYMAYTDVNGVECEAYGETVYLTALAPLVTWGGTWLEPVLETTANMGKVVEFYLKFTQDDPIQPKSGATIVRCGIFSNRGEHAVDGNEPTLDAADNLAAVKNASELPSASNGVTALVHRVGHLTNGERVDYRFGVEYIDINGVTRTYYSETRTYTASW